MEYFAYSQKSFVYKYVVMMSDTDQFRHMSFANYLRMMFLATDALFVSCLDKDLFVKNRLKLVASKMQFREQTVAGDQIIIKCNASGLSGSDFSLLYTFVIEGTAKLVGLARQSFKLVKVDTGEPLPEIPPTVDEILRKIHVQEDHLLYKY